MLSNFVENITEAEYRKGFVLNWNSSYNFTENFIRRFRESNETTKKETKKTKKSIKRILSEPRCGPIGASLSLSMQPCDVDAPQPIIDRRPSVSLFKWGGSQKRNDATTPTAARQGLILIEITHIKKNEKQINYSITYITTTAQKHIHSCLVIFFFSQRDTSLWI